MDFSGSPFDIIIAEGFFNVVGFNEAFIFLSGFLKNDGYLLIHDEYPNRDEKISFFSREGYELVDSIYLDENIWWENYCQCLNEALRVYEDDIKEHEMNNINTLKIKRQMEREISLYKKILFNSDLFIILYISLINKNSNGYRFSIWFL